MKKSTRYSKTSLEIFPELDGLVIDQGHGSFVELNSDFVPPSAEFPQGVRFSMTLRDADGRSLLKYSMAHNHGLLEPAIESDLCVYIQNFDRDSGEMDVDGSQHVFESVSEMLQKFFESVDLVLQLEDETT